MMPIIIKLKMYKLSLNKIKNTILTFKISNPSNNKYI